MYLALKIFFLAIFVIDNAMSPNLTTVEASPIEAILLVDLYQHQRAYRAVSHSLPGHLIQLMLSGESRHEVSGRQYTLRPGDLIWYHEDETVTVDIKQVPWSYHTLNFIAPTLSPPPYEMRVRKANRTTQKLFAQLHDTWFNQHITPTMRQWQVRAHLETLLGNLQGDVGQASPYQTHPPARLWWDLEKKLREQLHHTINLDVMEQLTNRSRATIARSCQHAVNCSPIKRVRHIRMSLARGWVQRSNRSITQIAEAIGYPRVHEFSRDYKKHFGLAPTHERRRGQK